MTVGTLINFNNNFNWHYNLELAVHLAADGRLWHYNLELAVHLMADVKFFSYICKKKKKCVQYTIYFVELGL